MNEKIAKILAELSFECMAQDLALCVAISENAVDYKTEANILTLGSFGTVVDIAEAASSVAVQKFEEADCQCENCLRVRRRLSKERKESSLDEQLKTFFDDLEKRERK